MALTLEKFSFSRERGRGKKTNEGGAVVSKKEMEESLKEQLRLQNKMSKFYQDLVSDYLFYWDLKRKLIADIRKRGIRYSAVNGNGIEVEKPNESVQNLQKTTVTMLKILADLNLKEPLHESNPEQDYLG